MQPFPGTSQQVQTRKPVLVFIKGAASPVVLYGEDGEALYKELRVIIESANKQSPKLIEKLGKGPIKKLCVFDTEITGIAIQEETYVQ